MSYNMSKKQMQRLLKKRGIIRYRDPEQDAKNLAEFYSSNNNTIKKVENEETQTNIIKQRSKKRTEFTSMEREAIVDRYKNGATKTQLAKDFNTTIYQINKYI